MSDKMDITFVKTSVDPVVRKMDFGAVTVCSKCGNGRIPYVGEDYKACCEGARLIPLREYFEKVKGIPFDNDKWRFEETTVYAGDKSLWEKEMQSPLGI